MAQYVRNVNDHIEVQVVNADGTMVSQRPVNIEDLLRVEGHRVDLGNGVALQLEEFDSNESYSEETAASETELVDDEEDHYSSESEEGNAEQPVPRAARSPPRPPPGTQAVSDWYGVLNALRHERRDILEAERALGGAATRLRRLSVPQSRSQHSRSLDAQPPQVPPEAQGGASTMSRREVWAALAPRDMNAEERSYRALQYVSVLDPEAGPRQFRPGAVSFHAMVSYLSSKDRCQHVLVYGGVAHGGRTVEREVYEFSLLTGNWRRVEGKQFVPAGHYGHAMVVAEAVDKVVVVGGIGPGGVPVKESVYHDEPMQASRAELLLALAQEEPQLSRRVLHPSLPITATAPLLSHDDNHRDVTTSGAVSSRALVGFVPYLFDMDLTTQRWRAIQTSPVLPLVFHAAVSFGKAIYIFGGLTADLTVSGQMLAVDVETYAIRPVKTSTPPTAEAAAAITTSRGGNAPAPASTGPCARFLHTAVRYGNFMLIFGGYDSHNEPLTDTWAFDMLNERWEELQCLSAPAGRAGHAACVVGCRMLVTGGFDCSLTEITFSKPVDTVMELNLVPTLRGEHVWRDSVPTHPRLPPLAFSTSASCGDGVSSIVFGGLTKRPKATLSRRVGGEPMTRRPSVPKVVTKPPRQGGDHHSLFNSFITLDDGVVLTFPLKQKKHTGDGGAGGGTHVNELGIEVDENELPDHFKTFIRRQDDFLMKKQAAIRETMHKTTLEERETMEPTLYLSTEEIDLLLEKSEGCCTAFTEAYPMDQLPANVPDRETRIHIVEECVSLSRQVRDVIKSMKGSAPGVTAVKSKTHRKRAGQKFEDYSAAKPLRHAVITHLLESINKELTRMHKFNKILRTVDWEEKEKFIVAVEAMQGSVNALSRALNSVMNRYVKQRVESLMKGVEKHKEVMRLLTEVVTRNRHDKIFRDDNQHDAQRERVKRVWAAGESPAKIGVEKEAQRSRSRSRPRRRSSAKYIGAGFYKNGEEASVALPDHDWRALQQGVLKVDSVAMKLSEYCRENIASHVAASTVTSAIPAIQCEGGVATPAEGSSTISGSSGPAVASLNTTAPFTAPPPPILASPPGDPGAPVSVAPPSEAAQLSPAGVLVPPPLVVPSATDGVLAVGGHQPTSPPEVSGAAPPIDVPAAGGTLSNKEIVIRHSSGLRGSIACTADAVALAARSFAASLEAKPTATLVVGAHSESSSTEEAPPSSPLLAPPPIASTLPVSVTGFLPPPPPPVTASVAGPAAPTPPATQLSSTPFAAPATATRVDGVVAHVLYLGQLRPLMDARERMARIMEKAPFVRMNEWDDNSTAGAPQDVKVEKLCRYLLTLVTSLLQSATSRFLASAGAKKPRRRTPVQPLTVVSIESRAKRAKPVTEATVTTTSLLSRSRSSRSRSSSSSSNTSSSLSETRASRHPPRALSAQSGHTATTAVASDTTLQQRPTQKPSGSQALEPLHMPLRAYMQSMHAAALPSEEQPNVGPTVPLVSCSSLWNTCDARGGGSFVSGSLSVPTTTELTAAPVVEATGAASVRTLPNVPMAAPPVLQSFPSDGAAFFAPGRGRYANEWAVLPVGGRKPSAEMMDVVVSSVSTATGAAAHQQQQATPSLAGTASALPPVISIGTGPVVHIPESASARARAHAATAAGNTDHPHRPSAIVALTQINTSEPGVSYAAEPVTSIAPGTFVVNADYYYDMHSRQASTQGTGVRGGVGSAVPTPPPPATGAASWADAEEDYFYFGRDTTTARPASGGSRTSQAVMNCILPVAPIVAASSTRHTQPVRLSPALGTVLHSQRVNAELRQRSPRRSASNTKRSPGRFATARAPTSSAMAKRKEQRATTAATVRSSATNDPLTFKGQLTPGELQILQARERLRRQA